MEDIGLIVDLVLALGAALLGGVVAQRLGLPSLLGYVVAGAVVGPNTPGLTADFDRVQTLANLGVAFLMFALGVEFSFSELRRMRAVALVAGGLQIPLTMGLGTVVGWLIGWPLPAALLLGGTFAISSSIVALKLLIGRGEGNSPQGRAALSLGVVQDLSLVPMLALLPLLAGGGENFAGDLARSLAVAGLALAAVIFLGTRVVPRILFAVARLGSRELFLITVVVIALGTAIVSQAAGLSFALGAFLAGLVVSESEFDSQVLSEIAPLRDIFATLFFVALGMLIDPSLLAARAGLIALLVATLVIGKLLILGGSFLAAGLDHRTTTLAALAMAQIGEFSFVLAGVGLEDRIIDRDQYALILAVALGSIIASPLLLRSGPKLVRISRRLPGVGAQERSQAGPPAAGIPPEGHVVICGYGRVGSELGSALAGRGIAAAVVEINPAVVRELRQGGVAAFYGDAGSEEALRHAGVERARALAVTVGDLVAAEAAVRVARLLNPGIDVVTRATTGPEGDLLRRAGANEVVQPEFEAGLEFVRHVLGGYGVSATELAPLLDRRRSRFYGTTDDAAASGEG